MLYDAEAEFSLNPEILHQYTIVIGEKGQLWMEEFTWEYNGEGPRGLLEVFQTIDPEITFNDIIELERESKTPIVFKLVENRLVKCLINREVYDLLCVEDGNLPWYAPRKTQ